MDLTLDLRAHGHGSRLLVCVQLHGLHGRGSFTVKTTLVQDRVKHLVDGEIRIYIILCRTGLEFTFWKI